MIARIKILLNQTEIETAQAEIQRISQLNHTNAQENLEAMVIEVPAMPESQIGETSIALADNKISLAFINGKGEISVKHDGETFNLVYDEQTWKKLKTVLS